MIMIPQFRNGGFFKRVRRLVGDSIPIVELKDGVALKIAPYSFLASVNPNFTNNDSIISIRDQDHTVIHANDNWHVQPPELINQLNNFSAGTDVTYLAQVGIAGSYPLYYQGWTWAQRGHESKRQLRRQLESIKQNSRSTHAVRAYSYANESSFEYFPDFKHLSSETRRAVTQTQTSDSLYCGELSVEGSFTMGSFEFRNLRRNVQFLSDYPSPLSRIEHPTDHPQKQILESGLVSLKAEINNYLKLHSINATVDIQITTYEALERLLESVEADIPRSLPTLTLYASESTWLHILEGRWTLEALTIGGCGVIQKTPNDWHAGLVHDALSRFGYRYQATIHQT